MRSYASTAGPKWSLHVAPHKRAPPKEPTKATLMKMLPPAPLNSVPFYSKDTDDMHTRIIMLGSLARCYDKTRAFWESAWGDSTITVPMLIEPSELRRGDVLFLSRNDATLSLIIRFWTQSPFNHACIMESSSTVIETYPTKGIVKHNINLYLKQLQTESASVPERPFGIWVVRPSRVPDTFMQNLFSIILNDYSAESLLQNLIHMGNSDGPDHPIPIPWRSPDITVQEQSRQAVPWEERKEYSCAELIARLLELDPFETFQWLPSNLFAKLISLENAQVFKLHIKQDSPIPIEPFQDDHDDPACRDSFLQPAKPNSNK